MTNSTRLICPPWQIESGHLGCGKLTRQANQLGSQKSVKQIISEFQKFRLPADPNHFYIPHCPVPQRGVGQRHQRGAGCGGRGRCQRRRRCSRTVKSCGSDAPMLASSLREEAQTTVSNKPGHRGDHEVRRKTIARGMPGRSGEPVVTTLGCLFLSAPRLRVHRAPGIPCALYSRRRERSCKTSGKSCRGIAESYLKLYALFENLICARAKARYLSPCGRGRIAS